MNAEEGTFVQVGTILGTGTYVSQGNSFTIGENGIGTSIIGGEATNEP